jgi:hypothetical protein
MALTKQAFLDLGNRILDYIGERTQNYMRFGGEAPIPDMVTNRTGRLFKSLMGIDSSEAIRKVESFADSMILTIGTQVPYAALLEKGGVRAVTDKMRRFFWAKYFETRGENPMWSALRFKSSIVYPPRPYLRPAVEESVPKAKEMVYEMIKREVQISFQESIKGEMKAKPL